MDKQNPYSPPKVDLGVEPELLEYVGFWARTGAMLIDSLLMLAIFAPILIVFYGKDYFDIVNTGEQDWLEVFISYVLPAVAVILFWVYKSATPGKMLIHAKIIDERTGDKPSTGQLIVRYIGYYLSSIVFMLGFIWIAFDPRKQGWHDKIAKTLVVRQ